MHIDSETAKHSRHVHNIKPTYSLLEVNETTSEDKHVFNCFALRDVTTNLCNYMTLLLLSVWPFLCHSHLFDLVLSLISLFEKNCIVCVYSS